MRRDGAAWRPVASIEALRARAALLGRIRAFFAERGVFEVDTPQLCPVTATDPLLQSIAARPLADEVDWFLQTSPEFAMKRLLAAGSGAIYQMGKAFRRGECGPRHNPEFTMLEWYRPGFDTAQLIEEVAQLVGTVIGARAVRRDSWRKLFICHAGLDPRAAPLAELRARASGLAGEPVGDWSHDALLDLLFSECVEPRLGHDCLQFVDGFPGARASLACLTVDAEGVEVADRFELFVDGVELANGYNELCDADELRRRVGRDNAARAAAGLQVCEPDERLLAALASGLPESAGVALGVDRLVMIALGARRIDEVIAFAADRA